MTVFEQADLLYETYQRSEEEIDCMIKSGIFDPVIRGYCLHCLEAANIPLADIDVYKIFEKVSPEEAREKSEQAK